MKTPKLNNKELNKFIEVLGVQEVKYLYCYDKIKLTSEQLTYLCEFGKEKEDDKGTKAKKSRIYEKMGGKKQRTFKRI